MKIAAIILLAMLFITPRLLSAAALCFQVDTNKTLTTNLVSYYKEDANSNDSFGTNNGTETGVSHPAGQVNNSVLISTSTSNVQYSTNFSMATSGATFAVWINIPSNRTDQVDLITDQTGAGNSELYRRSNGNGNNINYYDGTNNFNPVSGPVTIPSDGNWHFLILEIISTANITVYRDNSSSSYGATVATGQLGYLSRNNASFNASGVKFDEIGEWSKVLSDREAQDLWNGGSGQTMVPCAAAPTNISQIILMDW
jgi:hypothetical protein